MQIGSVPHLGAYSALSLAGAWFRPQIDQIFGGNIIITIRKDDHSAVLGADAVGICRLLRGLIGKIRGQIC